MSEGVTIDGWLDRKATAEFCNVTEWWLEKHCHDQAVAPPYIRHGRKVWYRLDDLRAWKSNEQRQAQLAEPTGDTLAAVYNLGQRRPEPPAPNPQALLKKYLAEHGPSDLVIDRRVFRALYATFTRAQRKLFENKLAAVL